MGFARVFSDSHKITKWRCGGVCAEAHNQRDLLFCCHYDSRSPFIVADVLVQFKPSSAHSEKEEKVCIAVQNVISSPLVPAVLSVIMQTKKIPS